MNDLNRRVRDIWNRNAAFWDEHMGEGNPFQRWLLGPALERFLQLRGDELVLEIACGNGVMARRMARLGARVMAVDFAEEMLKRARGRTTDPAGAIEYRLLDATDEQQLLALGESRFDAALCNMAMMDIADIEPLLSGLRKVLKPGGRFVFSVMHPCFNSMGTRLTVEQEDVAGELVEAYSVRVMRYLGIGVEKGTAMVNQPEAQYYFHRTLSVLFNSCFRAGFLLDALAEPSFSDSIRTERSLNWTHFTEIPPVLIARLQPAAC